jgi:hypothetical protein
METKHTPGLLMRRLQKSMLPPATLRALLALDAAENKRLPAVEFRRACGVKTRAYHLFKNQLLDAYLIAEVHGSASSLHAFEITRAGMLALIAHRAAIAKAEGR